MTGFRGRRGFRGRGRFNRHEAAQRAQRLEVYKGEHANDFPATIALIEVGSALRQPRHRFKFNEETMTLEFQDKTLKVHGCADYEEGKRVAADLMLQQIYPTHTLTASTKQFHDSHELVTDTPAWDETMTIYNDNREKKRLQFRETMQTSTDYDQETKDRKIANYEKNYAVQKMPDYAGLCTDYLERRQRPKKQRTPKNERMSDGENSGKSSDKRTSGSEHEASTDESDEEDPDRETYRRIVEMLADVSRVQNIPYPEYIFKRADDEQSELTMKFQTTVITMTKARALRVNMRGIVSDLMLNDLFEDHEITNTTQDHIEACKKTTDTENWDDKVAKCRQQNEQRVREKIAHLEKDDREKMTDEVKAEIRARYDLWLQERPQPTYAELCARVEDRLTRLNARRSTRRRNFPTGGRENGRGGRGRGYRGKNFRGRGKNFRGRRDRGPKKVDGSGDNVDKREVKADN